MEEIHNTDHDADTTDAFTHRCERNGEICLCGNRLLLGLRWVFIWLLYIGHHKRAIDWIVKRGVLRSLISHIFETWMAVRSGVFNPKFPFFIFLSGKARAFQLIYWCWSTPEVSCAHSPSVLLPYTSSISTYPQGKRVGSRKKRQ